MLETYLDITRRFLNNNCISTSDHFIFEHPSFSLNCSSVFHYSDESNWVLMLTRNLKEAELVHMTLEKFGITRTIFYITRINYKNLEK